MARRTTQRAFVLAAILLAHLPSLASPPSINAQELHPPTAATAAAPASCRLTLQEAKERALANSKLLNLASMNAQAKAYAIKVARADYFPKVTGAVLYFHFNDGLGNVLSTKGRTITGPQGVPLLTFPPTAVQLPILQQDSTFTTVNVLQPITDLLKVRQGVRIAQAEEQIAQADLESGTRVGKRRGAALLGSFGRPTHPKGSGGSGERCRVAGSDSNA